MDVWVYGCVIVWVYGRMGVWVWCDVWVWVYGLYGCMGVWLMVIWSLRVRVRREMCGRGSAV